MNITKKIIAYVFVSGIAIVLGAYFALNNNQDVQAQSTLERSQSDNLDSTVGNDILILLGQIESLTIDTKLFQRKDYTSLVDLTVAIPEQNIGRPNPFAPFDKLGYSAPTPIITSPLKKTPAKTNTNKLLPSTPH